MRPLRIGVMSFAHTHAIGYLQALAAMPDVEVRGSDPDGAAGLGPGPAAGAAGLGPGPATGAGAGSGSGAGAGSSLGVLRGRGLAEALGVGYLDSYDELLAWQPDAVVVASENTGHRALVERAAAAGAHVLCEKPLATTWEDGLAMRDAVEAAGVLLMVAFPVRFASSFARLRATHDAGALGQLFAARGANTGMLPRTRDWFTDPERSGGGALVDHVVHIADLLDALTGAQALTVTAVANRTLHADRARAETAALVTISYDDGLVAAIDCSWSRPDTSAVWGGLTLDVVGTQGTVSIDPFGPAAHGIVTDTGLPIEARYGADLDQAMLRVFLDAVRTGVQPQPDAGVGLRTLAIVLAAQESARTGRTVPVAR